MFALRGAFALAVLAGLSAACAPSPTTTDCETMLERGVELAYRAKRPEVTALEIEAEKARRRRQPPGRAAIEACAAEVSREAVTCAVEASHIDEYERCLVVAPWPYRL